LIIPHQGFSLNFVHSKVSQKPNSFSIFSNLHLEVKKFKILFFHHNTKEIAPNTHPTHANILAKRLPIKEWFQGQKVHGC